MNNIPPMPQVSFAACSNIFIKMMLFRKGEVEQGHEHAYDHLSLLARGAVIVEVDGKLTTFTAPHIIYMSKNHKHQITALEDNTTWYCIHALRNADSTDIIDSDMIPVGITDALTLTKQLFDDNKIDRSMALRDKNFTEEELEYIAHKEERDFIGSRRGDIPTSDPSA